MSVHQSQLRVETVVLFGLLVVYGMDMVSYRNAMFALLFIIAAKLSMLTYRFEEARSD